MFENFLEVRYSAISSRPPRHSHAGFDVCVFLPLATKIVLPKVKLPFCGQFPIAAVTNHQKLVGSKQHKVILWQFSRPKIWNQFNWAKSQEAGRTCPFWSLWGESVSLPFLTGGHCILWLGAPFLHHSNLLFPLAHFSSSLQSNPSLCLL